MNGKGKFTSHKGSKFQEGQSVFIKQRCKFINCFITYDKYLLHKDHRNFDAVVFNSREIVDLSPNEIDLTRSVDQKYIFRSLQFPEDYPICNQFFDNFFNWTWTYNLDSDIPHKKKGIAWIVNKCKTKVKHQEFVRELNKELKLYNYTIDIYGTCGDNKCPGSRIINCLKIVEKNYFFQLIVEDTIAEDYVSEKMVKAMTRIVIPIVLGSSDYNNFLPPGSYINAQSFDMKKLGAIIDYLIRNPTIYGYFFDWKNYYYYTEEGVKPALYSHVVEIE
ncbi:alpha-(1,3)-fucosyltransferase C-like [Vanessa atalanta]|uniref:alpha-(1,3)-fucosyltransferase C-like n=1 Tax=Vanessa atalanta TaxID=42275 RepID=UPI001FCE1EAE|nr:alpha-(1,3)-fucosyltransferase C-like [Vanessa atalanta]